MNSRSPQEAGFTVGVALEPVGRAKRYSCWGDAARSAQLELELWRLPLGAEAIGLRLTSLGARGVAGFIASDCDEEGPWLVRRAHESSLATWIRQRAEPVDFRSALAMVAGIAESASACEQAALFPGALTPESVDLQSEGRCELRADGLVHGLFGASAPNAVGASARWMAPEQADGESANNASNRYVIGLILYRLLAGEHAFAGRGLRLGLSDRADRGAPPFSSELAASLPPGLQGYCLRLLDPDPAHRPDSAAAIASGLRRFLEAPDKQRLKPLIASVAQEQSAGAVSPATTSGQASRGLSARALVALMALVGGVATASFAIASIPTSRETKRQVNAREPLISAHSVEDCASCHPRQASEWQRSVMAHAAKSPLFQSLEMLIEEQVGKSRECPEGAGILRSVDPASACRSRETGNAITGSGGELWCVNCHVPGENLRAVLPAWDGVSQNSSSRQPLRELLPAESMEGIGCAFCHQVQGPVRPGNERVGSYEGNPRWTSSESGREYSTRPEDRRGLFGIANSGYLLDPSRFLAQGVDDPSLVPGGAHRRPDAQARAYLQSSEFCGSCHDVRLFGTDVIGASAGEHFKRLRNAYSEWVAWSRQEERAGREAASCQDCHMSTYPGVCVPGQSDGSNPLCPSGTVFSARAPGAYPTASTSAASLADRVTTHYFSGVDIPLSPAFPIEALDSSTLDAAGIPIGARQRRDLLLANAFRLEIDRPRVQGDFLQIPLEFENVGAGHRVPAGFSQEREVWIHLRVTDGSGQLVYEVGRVGRGDEDLADKIFVDINTSDETTDFAGRPLGLFGADIIDGPDVPQWTPERGSSTSFRGQGLVNLQNGFLRCVRCIGEIDDRGQCQAGPGQGRNRADRYVDGDYDIDTGECRSNLRGEAALFEVYFPVGALDATRGLVRGPDAIVDTRSAAPNVPIRYTYDLPRRGSAGPYRIEARMMFRAFPPFLLRAFADYELNQDRRGRRPGGPLLSHDVLERLEATEIARAEAVIP